MTTTASPIRTERHDDILVIVSDNPPVNALGAAVRQGLEAAVKQGVADASITAMVIRCDGRTFFAGADITEFGKPMQAPLLPMLVDMIEASDKPIVAAIHGTALGGGCEVALACHYRVAAPSAKLGTPEVKLGLLPGAGGTQRLPRVAGIPLALEMTAKGDPVSARTALDAGLIDRIVGEDSLAEDALAFAREIRAKRPIPRASQRALAPDPDAVAAFTKANARRFRGFEAPAANIACVVKASETGYPEGVAFERSEFMRLMTGNQSAAQRHLFFAERQAARIDDVPAETALRPVDHVGIIGAGTMGGGIAMNFLSAGLPVTIVETSAEALDRGVAVIRRNYEATAAKGRMTPEQVERAMALLTPTLEFDALGTPDLVIEAVYENMEVKQDIFTRLDAIAKPGAILASNTSYLDIDAIAACTARPQDVVGMHFFSPANVMKLLEVVRGAKTAGDVLATVMALAKKIRKVAVVAGVTYGFIGNRMLIPRQTEANALLLEGASPEQIDRVHVEFGMPMGPFQMADLAGVDIGWHRDPARIESVRDQLAVEGRWGQKKQAGFYDYDEKRTPRSSPRVAEILDEWRLKTQTPQRQISDEEIVERTLYTMVNEGALILEEGKAQRASDIDVVWIYGYGWPVYRGGPMFWAKAEGYDKIVAGLDKHGFPVANSLRQGSIK
ncbi:3-hydroxyacyl-CoA dehydrogenase NAD-binding domain-containing protein [Sphingomonas carotinifaciens]|uniref:3-hydroxyacyl-CoA dehydrogenase n=1 Tax=Sphingomonas carotinifaciens TaxID=1166323 RepID=A0A1G7QKI5_9SPHN|nr:3-hydroxyacyl-CoA dehydrogenase NAD-binding domain-containing protein [Sphingomonas carotinifaciens]MBB4087653.1 3-hydroxyacyl-CoA dehydrogenase [Sphingomonas carotinifaciens]MWC44981.1 3-hydroxyacyl-CoA dehydrogenase [Sphingomonas carotinifaciens]SDF98985.1 short chain enoyl-CoA hydratase /3-hydroxyacyl-CoA dehydrogenase [Sphingomonas carotinifaciens]